MRRLSMKEFLLMFKPKSVKHSGVFCPCLGALYFWRAYELRNYSKNNRLQQINFRFFIPCIFYTCYNKNYQQMRLFVLCLYFLFLVFSLHVSGFHEHIIRGISSCCLYATIWFMQCFVDRLRASADCFVVVTSVY